jgi:hypothetical protein
VKHRHIGFLLCLGALAVRASTVTAPAADFTCQVYGDSLMLDETDFKALKGSQSALTREQFASLEPTSPLRIRICESRKLWRLIKDGKADKCDLTVHYKNYNPLYFDASELDKMIALQMGTIGKKCPN